MAPLAGDSVFLAFGVGRFNDAEQFSNPNILDIVYVTPSAYPLIYMKPGGVSNVSRHRDSYRFLGFII